MNYWMLGQAARTNGGDNTDQSVWSLGRQCAHSHADAHTGRCLCLLVAALQETLRVVPVKLCNTQQH